MLGLFVLLLLGLGLLAVIVGTLRCIITYIRYSRERAHRGGPAMIPSTTIRPHPASP